MRVDFLGFPVDSVTLVEATYIWVAMVTLGRRQSTVVAKPGSIHCITAIQWFTGTST